MANKITLEQRMDEFFAINPIQTFKNLSEPCAIAFEKFNAPDVFVTYRMFENRFNKLMMQHDKIAANREILGGFAVKSVNSVGERVKIYVVVYANGVHIQHKLVLTAREPREDETLQTRKFGMNLVYSAIAFKYPTMNTIHTGVTEILLENKVKSEDILL